MATSKGLLLDTSTFIWTAADSSKLSKAALAAISNPKNKLFVSLASVWEMQIKHGLGKLPLIEEADQVARRYAAALDAEFLDIRLEHFAALYRLPPIHRDPFDRLLAVQAVTEGFTLVSPDAVFRQYPVIVAW